VNLLTLNPLKSLQIDNLPDQFGEIISDLGLSEDKINIKDKEVQTDLSILTLNDIVRGISPKL